MAFALRNRSRHRWRIFNSRGSFDGPLFHGAGCRSSVLPLELGKSFFGRRLRWVAHYIRRGHCEEIWRVNLQQFARSAKNPESDLARVPPKPLLPISIA